MLGITLDKIVVLAILGAILLGPERLPSVAATLGRWLRAIRGYSEQARERVEAELGEEFRLDDLRRLDPRQYDPRRLIRDALVDDETGLGRRRLTDTASADAGTPPIRH